jgi:hypothetical protein
MHDLAQLLYRSRCVSRGFGLVMISGLTYYPIHNLTFGFLCWHFAHIQDPALSHLAHHTLPNTFPSPNPTLFPQISNCTNLCSIFTITPPQSYLKIYTWIPKRERERERENLFFSFEQSFL